MSSELPTKAQLLIDKKILALQQPIQRLKCQRNQHARITILPPEILSNIFVEVASVVKLKSLGAASLPALSPVTRFNFSFVSQHWRNLALATPGVWGILPEGYPKWRQAMLQRSRAAGLTLNLTLYTLDSAKGKFFEEIMTKHADRLQDLELGSSYTNKAKLLDCFPYSTPRLRTLRLIVEKSCGEPIDLPDDRFSGAQLSTLELNNCIINWNSPLFTGLKLRCFRITNKNTSATPSDIFNALKKMPNLEILDLHHSLASAGGLLSATSLIALPFLQRLSISASALALSEMLRHLAVPTNAQVELECANSSTSDMCITLMTFFSLMIRGAADVTPPYCSLSISAYANYTITAWRNPWMYAISKRTRTDQPDFFLRLGPRGISLAQVAAAVPLSQVKALSLSKSFDCDTLVSNFGDLHLDTIVFDGNSRAASELIKALTYKKSSSDASYKQVPFPHLNHLLMYNVVFSDQDIDCITLEDIQECCMERFERGAPIQKVSIARSYNIYQVDIKALEEIVVDVEWDGQEIEYEDKSDEDED